MKVSKKVVVLILFVGVILSLFLSPLRVYLNPNLLFEKKNELLYLVSNHYLVSVLVFIVVYTAYVALSIPGNSIMTVLGGFLFNPVAGVIYVNIGATLGALILFLTTRYLLGDHFQRRYRDRMEKFNSEIEENGVSFLFTVRLIPLFPFFLINILLGLTKVHWTKYLWTTSLGIIPVTFVYTYLGYASTTLDIDEGFLTPESIIALTLLGLFSLLPIIIKKINRRKAKKNTPE